jgi:hypothetical protein
LGSVQKQWAAKAGWRLSIGGRLVIHNGSIQLTVRRLNAFPLPREGQRGRSSRPLSFDSSG